MLEYIDLLVHEFDFEIVGSYHYNPSSADPFGGYLLNGEWEVCLGLTTADTGRKEYGQEAKVPCDIDIYCDDGELKVWFSALFHTEDFGHRWSGQKGDRFLDLFGASASDAFYLNDGKYYSENNPALSAESNVRVLDGHNSYSGAATVLINGKPHDATAFIWFDAKYNGYVIYVDKFLSSYSQEEILIVLPSATNGGEVFRLSDCLGRSITAKTGSPAGIMYTFEDYVYHSGAGFSIEAATIRVLQWDNTALGDSVIYAALDTVYELEPMTIEILVSAPANSPETEKSNSFQNSIATTLEVGESTEIEYDYYVSSPNYQTCNWYIVEGDCISTDGLRDHCTITARYPGKAIVKCSYNYGTDEPNILTGHMENENHVKSKLYYFIVE